MSRFYGSLSGSAKTTATRRGFEGSGVMAHVRGWNFGVRTNVVSCPYCQGDSVFVYLTGGSNDDSGKQVAFYCENGCCREQE